MFRLSLLLLYAIFQVFLTNAADTTTFTGSDVVGNFTLAQGDPICSRFITHSRVLSTDDIDRHYVPHTSILSDGVLCSSPGNLTVFDDDHGDDIEFSSRQVASNNALLEAVYSMKSPLLIGVDESKRVCGSSSLQAGTSFLFMQYPGNVYVENLPTLKQGSRFMIIFQDASNQPCIYVAEPIIDNEESSYSESMHLHDDKISTSKDGSSESTIKDTSSEQGDSKNNNIISIPIPSIIPPQNDTPDKAPPVLSSEQDTKKEKSREQPDANNRSEEFSSATVATGESTSKEQIEIEYTVEATTTALPLVSAVDPNRADCLPANARTTLSSGKMVRMDNLRIGDLVLDGISGTLSTIILFSHRDSEMEASYLELETASGKKATLTIGHYLPINGFLSPASNARIGDMLEISDGTTSRIVRIRTIRRRGLYNPHTISGRIVVDGVVLSTYTTAFAPAAAHALLTPIRIIGYLGRSYNAKNLLRFAQVTIALCMPTKFIF